VLIKSKYALETRLIFQLLHQKKYKTRKIIKKRISETEIILACRTSGAMYRFFVISTKISSLPYRVRNLWIRKRRKYFEIFCISIESVLVKNASRPIRNPNLNFSKNGLQKWSKYSNAIPLKSFFSAKFVCIFSDISADQKKLLIWTKMDSRNSWRKIDNFLKIWNNFFGWFSNFKF